MYYCQKDQHIGNLEKLEYQLEYKSPINGNNLESCTQTAA